MSYSQILAEIGTSGTISPRLFERFVALLLTELTTRQGRMPPTSAGPASTADLLLPEGIDPAPREALTVCIKFLSAYSSRHVEDAVTTASRIATRVLLILSGKPNSQAKAAVAAAGEVLLVWDYEVIHTLVSEFGSQWVEQSVLPDLERVRLDLIVPTSSPGIDDWKQRRHEHISALHEAYNRNRLVLVTGAGLSVGAGLKNWPDLLNSLAATVIAKRSSGDSEHLSQLVRRFVELSDSNPLILARYLRAGLGESFSSEVAKVLYGSLNGTGTSDAYRAIARLCIPRRTGPGIRAVINYNYDDLLYRNLVDANVDARVISHIGERADASELPLFHVHGFLPRPSAEITEVPAPEALVLSEEEYHTLALDSYHWANIAQIGHFLDDTCLIIGHSLTDPNLRRLLSIAASHSNASFTDAERVIRPQHYAILRRWSAESFTYSDVPSGVDGNGRVTSTRVRMVTAPEAAIRGFVSVHHASEDSLYGELGLNIVWVENWSELPTVIDAIRAGAVPKE